MIICLIQHTGSNQRFLAEVTEIMEKSITAIPGSVLWEDPDDGSWNPTSRSKFPRPLYKVAQFSIDKTDEELFCIYEKQKLI